MQESGKSGKKVMRSSSKEMPSRSWYESLFLLVIPPLSALLVRLLMLSCRFYQIEGQEREVDALRHYSGVIYSTWHQRMSYLAHFLGSRHVTVMISLSRDGEYAARIGQWLGFNSIRGSTSRGGTEALRAIIRTIKKGNHAGMLADGPQGPARVAKIGSVVMARNAGVPLIPLTWGGDRCWMFNSWDRYLIPKPFSRVVVYVAEPIFVPKSARGQALEEYRLLLEKRLNEGTRWCDLQFGSERPWRKKKKKDDEKDKENVHHTTSNNEY